MNEKLSYPFDSKTLRRKRISIKRELLLSDSLTEKRIAVLGGSTTHDIIEMLELFLLNYGIRPSFYESEYGQYWQDAVFGQENLKAFGPDIIFIHTSIRNIPVFPDVTSTKEEADRILKEQFEHFTVMWDALSTRFHCPVIQNNFEYPYFRLMGNRDAGDYRGRVNFITRLNLLFYEYAQEHEGLFINDINYQSADYGIEKWSDPFYWYMYKYSLSLDAIPTLAFNVANIIKSIFGKNKKALALDLDNTLWGGVVGDDGADNLELGQETAAGQAYIEFQQYIKELQKQGVLLTVISKNEMETAMEGLHHPQMVLKPDDFVSIKANWEPKSVNLAAAAEELSLLPESFVFVDDNPAEREIIRQQVGGGMSPALNDVEHYISAIDRAGYFETTIFSEDDLKRNDMYKENAQRRRMQNEFADYHDYLLSLDMRAEIRPFEPVYMARIAQLTNKSNQFNLTTRRFTQKEIEEMADDPGYITLYGKLTDRFGDNGVVSVVIGKIADSELDIILWLMSCRVLKRDMEFAMMDELARECRKRNIRIIVGHYLPTAKNKMVQEFYGRQGFTKTEEKEDGSTRWVLDLGNGYVNQNYVIAVNPDRETGHA